MESMTELPIIDPGIAYDCRYFLGDRPCVWHKRAGAVCTCQHYDAVHEQVLIIKLDAMGDVLRTTALLPSLAEAHPHAAFTWITRPEACPLLLHNPYLTDVLPYGPDTLLQLSVRRFDRVINLDAGKTSAGLATLAQAARKDGFVLHERGHVVPTNAAARTWFEMGVSDQFKRQNQRTYQSIMLDILGLSAAAHGYVFHLTDEERRRARDHFASLDIDPEVPVVGLNTGAGGRWELKRWRLEGFLEVIERLYRQLAAQVVLLGGPGEQELNGRLREASPVPVFDTGCANSVRHFAALTERCNVIVTGDTLAMHIALATARRVVVLFGPTSAAEIDLYGLGEKVVPEMDCLGCYKSTCDFLPNCMERISADMVYQAIARQLSGTPSAPCPRPLVSSIVGE